MRKIRMLGVAAILAGAIAGEKGFADARPFAKPQQQFAVGGAVTATGTRNCGRPETKEAANLVRFPAASIAAPHLPQRNERHP
jgi:hypothetical protein